MPPPRESDHGDLKMIAAWFRMLEDKLNSSQGNGGGQYRIHTEADEDGIHGTLHSHLDVFGRKTILDSNLFTSAEYRVIASLGQSIMGALGAEAVVARGERQQAIATVSEAFEWMLTEARRGAHIQRYKGLGEMNPDQLWETTMNPDSRRLLQVRIEDAVMADEIFTTLMGDQVEPRRDFIEKNALAVANLDT